MRVFKRSIVCGLVLAMLVVVRPGRAEGIRYVDIFAIPGAGDGLTWSTAYRQLSDALFEARQPESGVREIRVAGGLYWPFAADDPDAADVSFWLVEGVMVVGGYAGFTSADPDERDLERYPSILSGNNVVPHVVRGSSLTEATVVDGFSIQDGRAFGNCCTDDRGAGIYVRNADVRFRNCRVIQNASVNSAAAIWLSSSRPVFEDCLIGWNGPGQTSITVGFDSHATFVRCDFIGNDMGAMSGGGAIFLSDFGDSSLLASECRFIGNAASSGGACRASGHVLFVNCLFSGNRANDNGFGRLSGGGGAIHNRAETLLVNCTFVGNAAERYGGGVATTQEGSSSETESNLTVVNSVFWGNDAPSATEDAQITVYDEGDLHLHYSCVEGLSGALGGLGNTGANPGFVDPEGPDGVIGTADDDLRLAPGSPLIDAGSNWAVPVDLLDRDGDGRMHELWPIDLDGHPRFADHPGVGDSGCGRPVVVDMGAYEASGIAFEIIDADVSGDGVIGFADVLAVLAAWSEGFDCDADLDLDGSVGPVDLLIVLDAWGGAG